MSRRIETRADGNGRAGTVAAIRERILEWLVIIAYFTVLFLYLTIICLWAGLLFFD
jgi:hypothetical protein